MKNTNVTIISAHSATGPAVAATYTGTMTGTATPITLTAATAGTGGNSIELTGDGTSTINLLISAWNTANPSNEVSLTSGDGTQIPSNGATAQLANGAATSALTLDSSKIDAQLMVAASAQAIVAGGSSIVGTLQMQGSNDPCPYQNNAAQFTPTNWTNLLASAVAISGNGTYIIPKMDVSYRWLQVVYTYTSGSGGTITINFNGIGF